MPEFKIKDLARELTGASSAAAGLSAQIERVVAGIVKAKPVASLINDLKHAQVSAESSLRSDADELKYRLADYMGQLKTISDQLEVAKKEGASSAALQAEKTELLALIAEVDTKLIGAERTTNKLRRMDLPQLFSQLMTVRQLAGTTVLGTVSAKYIQLSAEFSRTLSAVNRQLDERNRLLDKALTLQLTTGMTTKETADMFEILRQRGALFAGSQKAEFDAYGKAALGVKNTLDSTVKLANKLAVATGATRQESLELVTVSQQLQGSYAVLVELAAKLTKQTTLTGAGAINLVQQLGDLRAQYGLDTEGLAEQAKVVAAMQDALQSVGNRDTTLAVKFAGAISDLTTSTGQFAMAFGTGGNLVLKDSQRFIAATQNIVNFANQFKGDQLGQFKAFADNLGLSRQELQLLIRAMNQGQFDRALGKMQDRLDLDAEYEQQLADTGRVWRRLYDSVIALAVKGIWPLTKSIEFAQSTLAKAQVGFEKLPSWLIEVSKSVIAVTGTIAGLVAMAGALKVIRGVIMSIKSLAGFGGREAGAALGNELGKGLVAGAAGPATEAAKGFWSKFRSWKFDERPDTGPLKKLWNKMTEGVEGQFTIRRAAEAAEGAKSRTLIGRLIEVVKTGYTGTRAFLTGLLGGPASLLGRIFTFMTGPLGLAITGISLLLTKWFNRRGDENLKRIDNAFKSSENLRTSIDKAIKSFADRAAAGASATELMEMTQIQRQAALDLGRSALKLREAETQDDRSVLEKIYQLLPGTARSDVDILNQGVREQVLSKDIKRLIDATQSAVQGERAKASGQLVAEAPRASLTRLDELYLRQQELVKLMAAIGSHTKESREYLEQIVKLNERQIKEEAARASDAKSRSFIGQPSPYGLPVMQPR